MRRNSLTVLAALILALGSARAQVRQIVGTVSGFKVENAEVEIKPDNAPPVACRITPDTIVQRIAPGESDLNAAKEMKITDIAIGDRVLVALEPGRAELRRIIVMSAADIARRNEADRQDWPRRGVSGIVAAKDGQ